MKTGKESKETAALAQAELNQQELESVVLGSGTTRAKRVRTATTVFDQNYNALKIEKSEFRIDTARSASKRAFYTQRGILMEKKDAAEQQLLDFRSNPEVPNFSNFFEYVDVTEKINIKIAAIEEEFKLWFGAEMLDEM